MEPSHQPIRSGLTPALPSTERPSATASTPSDSWLSLVPSAVFQQSPDGSFRWISPQVEEFTHFSPARWLEEDIDFWSCVHEADFQTVQAHFDQCRKSQKLHTLRYRLRLPSLGKIIWVEDRRRWISSSAQPGWFEGSWTDVSAEAHASQRLPHAAWQRALAALTPGMGHDLNNHFASILALSDNFVRKHGPENPFFEGAKTIRDAVQQAARLVQRVVGLHLTRTGEFRYHDLNEIARDSMDLLRPSTSRRIAFHTELCPGSLPIYADGVELRRAIILMVRNAVEAFPMTTSGSITFRTSPGSALPIASRPSSVGRSTPFVCLTLHDSGPGVPADRQQHLFTPWFSTKAPSEGTGLALSEVRRIAHMHGGEATYDPVESPGATFRLWLPQSDLTEADRASDSKKLKTVLLVGIADALDDAAQSLRQMGFHVTATPQHGLELLQATDTPYDILCLLADTDPSIGGRLVQIIRSRRWPTKLVCEIGSEPTVLPSGTKPDLSIPYPLSNPEHRARWLSAFGGAAPGSE